MMSSSSEIRDLARKNGSVRPGFQVVVALEYYDGPERGVAVFPSGRGVRFSSLGEEQSRMRRAFELAEIDDDWLELVASLPELGSKAPVGIVVPNRSRELDILERRLLTAASRALYVGVGEPNLAELEIAVVSSERLNSIKRLASSVEAFEEAHAFVAGWRS